MNAERWARLQALFEEGVALPAAGRAAWMAALDIDPALREELAGMLAADQEDGQLTRRLQSALGAAGEVPPPGTRLGAWRLIEPLGSGGMGLVFLAERADGDFRQQVAIKLIHRFGTLDAARQLRHERQVLAGLEHPGIARLYDGGETPGGQPYLVMEYIRGAPITDACEAQRLPLRRRMELLRDVAEAVHYAHQRLIVHRDIKPANVLLRQDGRPVLLDFGIAKLLDADAARGATQPWFTPAYASPEQRHGRPVSTATDVHALGLLGYQLMTGLPPEPDAEDRIALPSRRAPADRARALRGDLDTLVQRATAVEPDRRYPSAQAFADDIRRWLTGRPLLAAPDRIGYRLNKLLRRHPVAAGSLLALALAVTLFGWRLADERNRALRAEAVAEREAANARSVSDFLTALFREADPETSGSAALTPAELLARGRAQLRADASMSGSQRARLSAALAALYVQIGQPEQAVALADEALRLGNRASASERADWLRTRALAHDQRHRFADAEADYRAAVGLLRMESDPAALAAALASHGLVLTRLDRHREAEPVLREAIALQRELEGSESLDAWRYEVYLGEMLYNASRDEEALSVTRRAVAGLGTALGGDHPDFVSALGFYGNLLHSLGDNAAAEEVFLRILAHRERLLQRDSQKLALIHNALGTVYYNTGRSLEAIDQFRAALEIGAREGSRDDPSHAIDLMNLASLYEQVGDYAPALPLMRRANAVFETDPDNAQSLLPQSRQNLGRLLMLAGEAEESRRWLEMPIGERPDRGWITERGRQRLHLAEWERRFGTRDQALRWMREAEGRLEDIGGAGSPRAAQLARTRGLIAFADGEAQRARAELEGARARLLAARGERFVGLGEIDLDLAEVALSEGRPVEARELLARARRILDPVLAPAAPQRVRLQALEAAAATSGTRA
ncbi:protein kinase domain-containing protein [Pseudomarimonas salicorniae]|uniref:Serine/threonine-protein kinase n=1 Tax=Pseudomarimonas salicorniae TaxID=2933270 RepID=A0ABT0GCG7_9GAMM|nr:tetratricopeptide repeat protein [Lysobacter sp. CAU 1642]MCK7592052.1 serine/threonine-protein kinase [Lysobacter sp. CAU 1642]